MIKNDLAKQFSLKNVYRNSDLISISLINSIGYTNPTTLLKSGTK